MAAQASNDLLTGLLKAVSRSFYLTLRVLPTPIRPQIAIAYLLARTSDTIADTAVLPHQHRLEALQAFRRRITGQLASPLKFEEFIPVQENSSEQTLLLRCEESFALLRDLTPEDQARVRHVLDIITSGQELDLRTFADSSVENIVALNSAAALDDYTYRVAGCVGEFWTRMCLAHLFLKSRLNEAFLIENGVRFGKGLQLVNILRDLTRDLSQGRCYIPKPDLSTVGLAPKELLDPRNAPKFRPVFETHLEYAENHLQAGWAYTNALPWHSMRVRLACAWPILIGFQTIQLLRQSNSLDPASRVKVGRGSVRRIMARSVLLYPVPFAWQRMVRRL